MRKKSSKHPAKPRPPKPAAAPVLRTQADARTTLVGFRVSEAERTAIEEVAARKGHATVADCLRAAFNLYASTEG